MSVETLMLECMAFLVGVREVGSWCPGAFLWLVGRRVKVHPLAYLAGLPYCESPFLFPTSPQLIHSREIHRCRD